MEHFEIPEGEEAITIPYVCTEEYDGGDFLTYPQRKDWAEADLKSPLTCGRPIQEFNAFMQSWLYFGFLTSVLRIVGVEAFCSDFIHETFHGQGVISTRRSQAPRQLEAGREQEEKKQGVRSKAW